MTRVLDVDTMTEQVYTCSPKKAVISAYAQSLGDWNTWEYMEKYSHLVKEGAYVFACGNFGALKVEMKEPKMSKEDREFYVKEILRFSEKTANQRIREDDIRYYNSVSDERLKEIYEKWKEYWENNIK